MSFTHSGFYINGVLNDNLGISNPLYIIRMESDVETPWVGSKSILESNVPYIDTPFFYGTKKEPITLKIIFSLLEVKYTHSILLTLGRLFAKDKYVSFQTLEDTDKIYYIIPTGEINLITHGDYAGRYEMSFRTNAPHAWATSTTHTISATGGSEYTINNITSVMHPKYKDYRYYPRVTIALTGSSTQMTITNLSDSSRATTFTGLTASETLTIDNNLKILTSSTGSNRFTNFNKNWLYLVENSNILRFSHQATVTITTQYPIYC